MTAETIARRSPLAHRAADLEVVSSSRLSLQELTFEGMLNLRLNPSSEIATALGLPGAGRSALLATDPSTEGAAGRRGAWWGLWQGPDEWLLTSEAARAEDVSAWLGPQLAGRRGTSLIDLSANYATLLVAGPHARDLLEKAITIDLHPRSFGPGHCARTGFARGNVVLHQIREHSYQLIFRPSFGNYFTDWLIDAAQEFQPR